MEMARTIYRNKIIIQVKLFMRILVLSNEVWSDKINGNNVVSNWFEGMDATFANIYGSPGSPYNRCCTRYFQITDAMMVKSILIGKKAGKRVDLNSGSYSDQKSEQADEEIRGLYLFLKRISGSFMRLLRELIWLWGRYDLKAMKLFIDEFRPDIIFSERMASVKMLRLEKIVSKLCSAPMTAFTGDDEYSLRQLSFSPFFWINRFMVRSRLREMVKKYKIYYTLSYEQKCDYEKRFGCNMKVLQKCGVFEKDYEMRAINSPIKIIYAGKLYCNRWKVLGKVTKVLSEINRDKVKAVLEIYTTDRITKIQRRLLNDRRNSFIKGSVSQEELNRLYHDSDIALHVESTDICYRLKTRLSFSTKIIDCIFSGCAIVAYCWKEQSGWKHLKRENAAICVSNDGELRKALKAVCEKPDIIKKYAYQAHKCGERNHDKYKIQTMLLDDFQKIVTGSVT